MGLQLGAAGGACCDPGPGRQKGAGGVPLEGGWCHSARWNWGSWSSMPGVHIHEHGATRPGCPSHFSAWGRKPRLRSPRWHVTACQYQVWAMPFSQAMVWRDHQVQARSPSRGVFLGPATSPWWWNRWGRGSLCPSPVPAADPSAWKDVESRGFARNGGWCWLGYF